MLNVVPLVSELKQKRRDFHEFLNSLPGFMASFATDERKEVWQALKEIKLCIGLLADAPLESVEDGERISELAKRLDAAVGELLRLRLGDEQFQRLKRELELNSKERIAVKRDMTEEIRRFRTKIERDEEKS